MADSGKIVSLDRNKVISVEGYSQDQDPLRWSNWLRPRSWKLVVKRVFKDFFFDALMDRAATLTYFTLMAFAPTVLAAYSIAVMVFSTRKGQVRSMTGNFIDSYVPGELAPQAHTIVDSIISSRTESTIALLISLLISLFAASGYVRAFSRTANVVYGRSEGRSLIRTWMMMWVLTIGLIVGSVLVIFSNLLRDTIITGVIDPIAEPLGLERVADFLIGVFLPVWSWVRLPFTIAVLLVLIAVLYHFAPNVKPLRFRWLSLGAVVALGVGAGAWTLLALYIKYLAGASAYGAISTLMALLVVLWLGNTGLVLGIKIDAEILRARELQMGIESQRYIQAPPRSDASAQALAKHQRELEEESLEIAEID
ncbi:trehalose-binding protein [Corynebacterium phocae]|uniref:Trehalose-binding protein n=1 Tax=Corynebacterium phocae TaxID=161895 RepID=A0A1L7D647_9CORY|nr:YihY/virulence factor BrkB family protein [Corynebacterium phocae]APT93590.1 trehalose-binding protein [Corynebacterium phocae]